MPLSPGESVSSSRYRYTVISQIGEGGMSTIYLCQCSAPAGSSDAGRWVLKEMTVSYRDQKDQDNAVKLFLREAQLLQQLRHKNLPRVLEQFVLDRNGRVLVGDEHDRQEKSSLRYYTVMEFVEGEDLGKMLLRNPHGFAEAKVVTWGIEIATVLYYLHSQKPPIIFRDLKPSNIMISRGQVKLIDFGIARRFDAFKKKDTMRIGSPGYAPPEQYSGQTDRRSDIYALGVTLHQLLTGRDPSETQTPFKLPSVRGLKPAVSQATEAIVVQATELDPQARFKTALDMKRALQAILGVQSQPLPARPTVLPSPAPPPATPSGGPSHNVAPPSPARATGGPALGPPAVSGPPVPGRAPNPYARSASQATPAAVPSPYARTGGEASATAAPATPVSGAVSSVGAPASPPDAPTPAAVVPPPAVPAPPPKSDATKGPASAPAPSTTGGVMPHNLPTPPKTAKPRAARGPFLFLLAMLGWFGYQYHDDVMTFGRWLYGDRAPVSASPEPTPSPAVSPLATPTPTATPASVLDRAVALLDAGQVDEALDAIEDVRRREPLNPQAMIAWNNGLVLAQRRTAGTGFAVEVVQAVYFDDAVGADWLRGVALAQRDVNARGGVLGHRVVVRPFKFAAGDRPAEAVAAARAAKAVAALFEGPEERAGDFQKAYEAASLALLRGTPRGDAGDGATGPPYTRVVAAMVAALVDIKPKNAAVVASATVPPAVTSALEGELKKARVGAVKVFRDGGEHVSEVASVHPDLVIFLGDPRSLDALSRRLDGAHVSAPVLAGPGADASTDLARAGRLWIVTPYRLTGGEVGQQLLVRAWQRDYNVSTAPPYAAVQGYDMLAGLLARIDQPTAWSPDSVRTAVNSVTPTLPSAASGSTVGAERPGPGRWAVIHYQNGAPSQVREVAP